MGQDAVKGTKTGLEVEGKEEGAEREGGGENKLEVLGVGLAGTSSGGSLSLSCSALEEDGTGMDWELAEGLEIWATVEGTGLEWDTIKGREEPLEEKGCVVERKWGALEWGAAEDTGLNKWGKTEEME